MTVAAGQLILWRPWRAWTAALVAFTLVAAPGARERTIAAFQRPAASSFENLPAASQAAVSRALGRDDHGYRITKVRGGLQAANRRQGLEAQFTAEGVLVRAGDDRLGLSLTSYGYGQAHRPLVAASPRVRANRVEYRRGPLTEWYVNGPLGVEQGFTLSASPNVRSTGRLALVLALSGNLTPSLDPGARTVTFRGSSLRYAGLTAVDATGRKLPAWIELKGRTLVVRVDARDARYPVEIDPLVQQAKLTASDGGSQDILGASVAIADNTIVVGAPDAMVGTNRQGAAYVFVKPASGWTGSQTEAAKLSASDGAPDDAFGASVAIDGDTVVAGAVATIDGHIGQGAAYVFVKPAGGWSGSLTQNAKLTASDGAADDSFAIPVAIAGDTIVAGASNATVDAKDHQGAAYVFNRPALGWSGNLNESAKLTASDGVPRDIFGRAVAIAGDTIVAGAFNANAAYVFTKPTSGWSGRLTESARLTPSDGASTFGCSVAVSDDTLVVGACQTTVGSNTGQGAAYVFVEPASGWSGHVSESARLSASDGGKLDMLGLSVAIAGDIVLAGAPHETNLNPTQGAVYEFSKPPSGWSGSRTQDAKVTAADGAPGDGFGVAVAISGSVGVAGARHAILPDDFQPGAAYVLDIAPDTTAPVITVPAPITRTATSPNGATVVYSVSASDPDDAVASLQCVPPSGSTFPIGTTTVTCTATDTHGNTSSADFTVHVVGTQAIAFTSTPPSPALFGSTYTPSATGGNSGNSVVFSIDGTSTPGACWILGGTVSFIGTGTCIIDANQAGNSDYLAADQRQQSFSIGFTTTLSGSKSGSLTVLAGQAVYLSPGTTIGGSVTVKAGGAIWAQGAKIGGPFSGSGANAIRLCGSSVSGSLSITKTSGLIAIGDDDGPTPCAGTKIAGPAGVTGDFGGVEFVGNTVSGSLTITGNTGTLPPPDIGTVDVTGNKVSGTVTVQP